MTEKLDAKAAATLSEAGSLRAAREQAEVERQKAISAQNRAEALLNQTVANLNGAIVQACHKGHYAANVWLSESDDVVERLAALLLPEFARRGFIVTWCPRDDKRVSKASIRLDWERNL